MNVERAGIAIYFLNCYKQNPGQGSFIQLEYLFTGNEPYIIIFGTMHLMKVSGILFENKSIESEWLKREVKLECYLPRPVADPSELELLLINDGQNLKELGLKNMLETLYSEHAIRPLLCVGIYAGEERKMEYGISGYPDFMGRGAKAGAYTSFILEELLPFIRKMYSIPSFRQKSIAGFSLGGLMALDIVWNYPSLFKKAGVFSGSFWWRDLDQDDPAYQDDTNRIMHQRIRKGKHEEGLKFFFQCGNKDETRDRNHNGIIDSIEDTQDLISELEKKGYKMPDDIYYHEMPDGGHDIETWAKAFPLFLKWAFGVRG